MLLASAMSMKPLICTTPRLDEHGTEVPDRLSHRRERVVEAKRGVPSRRSTDRQLHEELRARAPTTDAHATTTARSHLAAARPEARGARRSSRRSRRTGAAYDRKNRRWLFRTPRHHAPSTNRPAPGNRIRVRRIVSSRCSPSKPGAMTPHDERAPRAMPSEHEDRDARARAARRRRRRRGPPPPRRPRASSVA